jgi:hypothetical protein
MARIEKRGRQGQNETRRLLAIASRPGRAGAGAAISTLGPKPVCADSAAGTRERA